MGPFKSHFPRNLLFWRQGPIKWDLELRKASEFTVVRRCSHFHDKKLDSKLVLVLVLVLVLALGAKWDLSCVLRLIYYSSRRTRPHWDQKRDSIAIFLSRLESLVVGRFPARPAHRR